MDDGHAIVGYSKCRMCGVGVPSQFFHQTRGYCAECWRGGALMKNIEVLNRASRRTVRARGIKERRARNHRGGRMATERAAANAREAAWRRLANLFPDIYAVLYDEERVRRGLFPVARYNPVEFEEVASETLDFAEVYDALRSSGVADADPLDP